MKPHTFGPKPTRSQPERTDTRDDGLSILPLLDAKSVSVRFAVFEFGAKRAEESVCLVEAPPKADSVQRARRSPKRRGPLEQFARLYVRPELS